MGWGGQAREMEELRLVSGPVCPLCGVSGGPVGGAGGHEAGGQGSLDPLASPLHGEGSSWRASVTWALMEAATLRTAGQRDTYAWKVLRPRCSAPTPSGVATPSRGC